MDDDSVLEKYVKSAVGRDLVGNPDFLKYNRRVIDNVRNRVDIGQTYEKNNDYPFVDECRSHARRFNRAMTSENVIVLVHPFYLSVCRWNSLIDIQKSDLTDYKNKVFDLLNKRRSLDANIAIFDTAHFYADCTSNLLKKGIVDAVYFTGYDNGVLEIKSDLEYFKDKNIFLGGAFNAKCLSRNITAFINEIGSEHVWALRDLILNHPDDYKSLKPKEIIYFTKNSNSIKNLSHDRIISSEMLSSMIGK